MKIALFYPSLYSDRKNPIAHFSRGLAKELLKRGHGVEVYESQDNPALAQLVKEEGLGALEEFKIQYPELDPQFYVPGEKLEDQTILDRADLVIVHAGNPPWLVEEVGVSKKGHGFILLFHDTLHLSATDPQAMERYDLSHYDGALVQGNTVKKIYLERNWAKKVWTWHQGADVGLFKPEEGSEKQGDLVWIGNWADGQRAEELEEFLIRPVKDLGIKATVHGVGYPGKVKKRFAQAGMHYGGWLPNYRVPELFAKHRMTIHIPRRPYVDPLHGIPTIRPFEAMACGIPLVCSPWSDSENLFIQGKDYLMAKDGNAMGYHIAEILKSSQLARSLGDNARETVLGNHSCAHRVDRLEHILESIP